MLNSRLPPINICPFSFNTKLANPAFKILNKIKNRPQLCIKGKQMFFFVTRQTYANEWRFIFNCYYIYNISI